MLKSELLGWHWAITWDNPLPANSSTMLKALSKLGRLTRVQTKTTYMFAPKSTTKWRQVRAALTQNLHPTKGNVFYLNLRSGRSFEWGSNTGHKWKAVI